MYFVHSFQLLADGCVAEIDQCVINVARTKGFLLCCVQCGLQRRPNGANAAPLRLCGRGQQPVWLKTKFKHGLLAIAARPPL